MNIKELRIKYKLSQQELSERTGIPRGRINGWEQRGTTPKVSDMIILKQFLASIGENVSDNLSLENYEHPNGKITVHQVTFDNYMEVKYLPVVAQAGYLNGYYDIKEHIDELDTMLVPKEFEKGNYLVVEISGDSMNDGTTRAICDGDRLLLKELDKSFWKDKLHFRQNLFVIISNEGIVCKQITEHNTDTHEILCHSWNDSYPDYRLNLKDVHKLFYVKKIVERRIKF